MENVDGYSMLQMGSADCSRLLRVITSRSAKIHVFDGR